MGVKVRMLVQVSGSRDGVSWPPAGGVIDVSEEEAASLQANGLAARDTAPEVAVADSSEVETAVKPKPRRSRKG